MANFSEYKRIIIKGMEIISFNKSKFNMEFVSEINSIEDLLYIEESMLESFCGFYKSKKIVFFEKNKHNFNYNFYNSFINNYAHKQSMELGDKKFIILNLTMNEVVMSNGNKYFIVKDSN